jgi:hypothetical protein
MESAQNAAKPSEKKRFQAGRPIFAANANPKLGIGYRVLGIGKPERQSSEVRCQWRQALAAVAASLIKQETLARSFIQEDRGQTTD